MPFRSGLIPFVFLFGTVSAFAQISEKYSLSTDSTVNRLAGTQRVYYATRIDKRPKIDGKLIDACWENGVWSGGFVQQVPSQGKKPSQETKIKILYDDNNLYVGFKCFDSGPGKIRPILSRRDNSVGDIAGIALDSYHDKQTAYEFNVAASGQKVDMVHLGAYSWDFNWDAVWDGKAQVYDSIWTSELQIPFNQIRFSPGKEQVWGMHVWRWIDRLEEESQWKLIPIDAPSMVYLFGELRGIEGINPKTNYEFLPYLNTRFSPNTDQENKTTYGIGLNGKVGLNSGFTLDYAFNPDFGQVEADPSVLNLTSYEVFNEEKRPFFLEGNTILDFSIGGDMLFYSRRIGHAPSYYPDLTESQTLSISDNTPILSALKLTGKTKNGLSVGVVQSITAKENATIYSGDSKSKIAVEPFTSFLVGRIKQDFNKGNTVLGGMVTSTFRNINDDHLAFLSKSAMAGGIDFQHNWKKRKYFVDFKGFFSDIKGEKDAISRLQLSPVHYYQRTDASHLEYDPERTSLTGWGGSLKGGKRSGKFRATGSLNWRSPGVDINDVGYLYQADLINELVNMTYKVSHPKGIVRSYFVEFEQEHDWSYGGENTLDRLKLHGYLQFNSLWNAHLNLKKYYNIFDTRELRGGPNLYKNGYNDVELFIQSNSVKKLFVGFGPRIRFYADQISKTSYFTAHWRWQINDRFSITSHTIFDNSVDHHQFVTRTKDLSGSTRYLVGTIDRNTISSTLRFEYFVSPEISIQYYGNPYASTGKYENFREVADASNKSLDKRYISLLPSAGNKYDLLRDGKPAYSIKNPDFNFQEFRSNLVARWEFRPGSTLYLVWTNTRSAYSDQLDQSIWKSFGNIWNVKPQNVFMIKFSYWFSI
ncbi:MAG: DUF5916 domain-containing protein [Bacteroidota bacterium]|nr:DUF5916 domain-containing protein [Bacteroidota bacterium]